MKPLYAQNQYLNSKSTDKLPCQCYYCKATFLVFKKLITQELKHKRGRVKFCSQNCKSLLISAKKRKKIICATCDKEFYRLSKEVKESKSGKHFCSQSCSAIYNNAHKTHGIRRSKLEIWMEEKLLKRYPDLKFHFNRKDTINSELDIYIPSLKLAFELNGIFHYEPIFGKAKLNQIQNNDQRKFQACIEKKISFCTIDVSGLKYFKEQRAQEYLDIICEVIDENSKSLLKS